MVIVRVGVSVCVRTIKLPKTITLNSHTYNIIYALKHSQKNRASYTDHRLTLTRWRESSPDVLVCSHAKHVRHRRADPVTCCSSRNASLTCY